MEQDEPNTGKQNYVKAACQALQRESSCRFSTLPPAKLLRIAEGWHAAVSSATLDGDYNAVAVWVTEQVEAAREQGFKLPDVVSLLRTCRKVAIKEAGWIEDQLAEVDGLINELLGQLKDQVPWPIPEGLNYLTDIGEAVAEQVTDAAGGKDSKTDYSEKRKHRRITLQVPIRLRFRTSQGMIEEQTRTENVSRGGIYFPCKHLLTKGSQVTVAYPFADVPGREVREYQAEVVRVDRTDEGRKIALRFLEELD